MLEEFAFNKGKTLKQIKSEIKLAFEDKDKADKLMNSGTSTFIPCNCSNATFVGVSTGQWNIIGCSLQSPDICYLGVLQVSSWSTNQSSFSTQLLHCGHVSELNEKLNTFRVLSHTGQRTNLPFLPARVRPVTFSKCSVTLIVPSSDTMIRL